MNITVYYSCHLCGLNKVELEMQAREPTEDLMIWIDKLKNALSRDHDRRSPDCRPTELKDVKIPIAGKRVGGPTVQ